jgi:hypothetical protein
MAWVKSLFLLAFLVGGLLLVRTGALPFWLWLVTAALVTLTRVLPRIDAYRDELQVGEDGVRREHGSRLRKTVVESVRWDELGSVEVRARETGPQREQMLFLLYGRAGNGVAVPGPLAQQHALAETLARRLPGWRQDLLAQATSATEPAAYTLWQAAPQEG